MAHLRFYDYHNVGFIWLVLVWWADKLFWWNLVHCYSRTPLIRPPSESHWCGRIRGMVAREGFVYEQKPLSVTRNVVVWEGWSLVRVVVRQGFYCIGETVFQFVLAAGEFLIKSLFVHVELHIHFLCFPVWTFLRSMRCLYNNNNNNYNYNVHTVFDLISEHALISEPPLFVFNLKKKKKKNSLIFLRDPVIISGPSHVTIFGSTVLHPG